MDEYRARLQEDLRGLVSGEVRCDDVFVQLYASDASIYNIRPLGVVSPRTTADVAATVQYAAERQIPVHARGAGTGLAGDSLGPGLVIDFSRNLRRILFTDREKVRVQPGVVHERLNEYLAGFGRCFGPDPAMSAVTTMGSVLALDSSGSHWLKYGSPRRHVLSLQVVLADGHTIDAGREPLVFGVSQDADPKKRALINGLVDLVRAHGPEIKAQQPVSLVNRCGYRLDDVLGDDWFDLAKVFVGSEGTLGLITEATVATQPLPRNHAMAMLLFDRLETAARAALEITPLGPASCDMLDRRLLSLARDVDPRYEQLIPSRAEAVLLVEFDGDDQAQVRQSLLRLVELIVRKHELAFDARTAFDAEEIALFWRLALEAAPSLYRLRGSERALPFVEDIAVPPAALPGFLIDLQNVLKQHQVIASLFAHAGHGQLHIRPFMDLANPEHVAKMPLLAAELYERVWAVGGTIAGEHGAGLSRTPFIRGQYGSVYEVFREVKRLLDPNHILNPGKVVAHDSPEMMRHLRPVQLLQRYETDAETAKTTKGEADEALSTGRLATNGKPATNGHAGADSETAVATAIAEAPESFTLPVLDLQLGWTPAELAHVTRNCNGCGACRAQNNAVRMCPIFRFAPAEEASPRAKANLMRGLLTGELSADSVTRDDFKAVADLCVNCQMCRLECPASVDIPKLMLEAKAQYVANNGLKLSDWMAARIERVCAVGSLLGPISNWVLSNHFCRWALEKVVGIARNRKLPRFAPRTFLSWSARRRLTRPVRRSGRKVLYFVDVYANYHDAQLGEALVRVLEHNGVATYVNPELKGAGASMISVGALELARRRAAENVAVLAEAVRQGYHIVASEPSAVLCLTREYTNLLDDPDARLVAENTSEACTYLWGLHRSGKLQLDFQPVNASLAYHMPCHLKALEVGSPGESLLRLIPGLRVHGVEKGCSGMAGTFGLKRENFRNSLRAGWGLISTLRQPMYHAGVTECSTCKMQMEQGTDKPTLHPIKLLALAYGLMPEVESLLWAKSGELVVT